jgi:DNA polymerase-3 subunit gamma/tau
MSETAYQVLARKYRPATFADLIGQDAMVRTLKNAFAADRIAQAFMMTGIRGTGKTTTARIIAKGLNCVGPDGEGSPTTEPCGVCEPCRAIAEGRHVDVLEMDAASNTGVGDMREVINSVNYRAASARYKIYIIDEVHMLSTSAFNALLKTLEEPPAHVKFIFATTEIRKVPVTVLSRCQRFDLRRIEPEVMITPLQKSAGREGAAVAEDALALITRAAEGAVRDAMSLLDQAISQGQGETSADEVRTMLGLADRGRGLDLFEAILRGDAAGALGELAAQYADGADPVAILRDLAELTHWISVVIITPDAAQDPTVSPDERTRGQGLAERVPMRVLTRMWQMLLKALEEVSVAPNSVMAAEMAVIRLTHVADLPTPGDLARLLQDRPPSAPSAPAPAPQGGGGGGPRALRTASSGAQAMPAAAPHQADPLARFAKFEDVVELISQKRDMTFQLDVENYLKLVRYSPGRIAFEPAANAPTDLAQRLAQRLQAWTGARWVISVENAGGRNSITEQLGEDAEQLDEILKAHPLVAATLAAFPDATITGFRSREDLDAAAAAEALPELPDDPSDDPEWDPFEDG